MGSSATLLRAYTRFNANYTALDMLNTTTIFLYLVQAIVDVIVKREERSLPTIIRKFRARTKVMGNELVDNAAKLAITTFPIS